MSVYYIFFNPCPLTICGVTRTTKSYIFLPEWHRTTLICAPYPLGASYPLGRSRCNPPFGDSTKEGLRLKELGLLQKKWKCNKITLRCSAAPLLRCSAAPLLRSSAKSTFKRDVKLKSKIKTKKMVPSFAACYFSPPPTLWGALRCSAPQGEGPLANSQHHRFVTPCEAAPLPPAPLLRRVLRSPAPLPCTAPLLRSFGGREK